MCSKNALEHSLYDILNSWKWSQLANVLFFYFMFQGIWINLRGIHFWSNKIILVEWVDPPLRRKIHQSFFYLYSI